MQGGNRTPGGAAPLPEDGDPTPRGAVVGYPGKMVLSNLPPSPRRSEGGFHPQPGSPATGSGEEDHMQRRS